MIKRVVALALVAVLSLSFVISPAEAVVRPLLAPESLRPDNPHTIRLLEQQGMDVRYIQLEEDYNLDHPYARIYRNILTGEMVYEVGGLPMVNAAGQEVQPTWYPPVGTPAGKFHTKPNLFRAEVDGVWIEVIALNDQPYGKAKKDDYVLFYPQLFIGGMEVLPTSTNARLLGIDPINSNYFKNTLEWDYGICKRRLRIIEGSILGSWVFPANPGNEVRILYNQTGNFRLELGEYAISDDEELITQSVFSEIEYPFEVTDSATFYPDAHEETTSVDGHIGQQYGANSGVAWATLRTDAGNVADSSATDMRALHFKADVDGNTDEWIYLWRSIIVFDTSGLPDGADITAATLSIYGLDKVDPQGNTPDVNIYSSAPLSNINLAAGDFDSLGPTAFSTAITYAGWSTVGYNNFILNASGRSNISKIDVSKFGVKNENYDADNVAPDWAISAITEVRGYTSEQGEGFKPKLVVTYTLSPPTVTTGAATSVEETTATLNGNITVAGGSTPTVRGFEWDTDSGAPYANEWHEDGSFGTGAFTHDLTGLTKGELYYCRAYATNTQGTGYGSEVTFLTKPDEPNTFVVSQTGDGIITITWVRGTGAQKTYIRGEADSYPTDRADGYEVYDDTGISDTDTGLTGGTTYYYRGWSFATDGGKTQYSDNYAQGNAEALESPTITTSAAVDIDFTTATLGGNITVLGDGNATDRGFVWGTSSQGDPTNSAPAAAGYDSNWTENGSFGTGAFTRGITGLTPGDTIYFRACAQNSVDWDYGAELSFKTLKIVLWFEPIAIISGTTLPDRSVDGNDGTITWGTNVNLTVIIGSTTSYATTTSEAGGTTAVSDTITPAEEPPEWWGEASSLANAPFYETFSSVASDIGVTTQTLYVIVTLGLATAIGLSVLVFTGSALISALVAGLIISLGVDATILGGWMVFTFILLGLGVLYLAKQY